MQAGRDEEIKSILVLRGWSLHQPGYPPAELLSWNGPMTEHFAFNCFKEKNVVSDNGPVQLESPFCLCAATHTSQTQPFFHRKTWCYQIDVWQNNRGKWKTDMTHGVVKNCWNLARAWRSTQYLVRNYYILLKSGRPCSRGERGSRKLCFALLLFKLVLSKPATIVLWQKDTHTHAHTLSVLLPESSCVTDSPHT